MLSRLGPIVFACALVFSLQQHTANSQDPPAVPSKTTENKSDLVSSSSASISTPNMVLGQRLVQLTKYIEKSAELQRVVLNLKPEFRIRSVTESSLLDARLKRIERKTEARDEKLKNIADRIKKTTSSLQSYQNLPGDPDEPIPGDGEAAPMPKAAPPAPPADKEALLPEATYQNLVRQEKHDSIPPAKSGTNWLISINQAGAQANQDNKKEILSELNQIKQEIDSIRLELESMMTGNGWGEHEIPDIMLRTENAERSLEQERTSIARPLEAKLKQIERIVKVFVNTPEVIYLNIDGLLKQRDYLMAPEEAIGVAPEAASAAQCAPGGIDQFLNNPEVSLAWLKKTLETDLSCLSMTFNYIQLEHLSFQGTVSDLREQVTSMLQNEASLEEFYQEMEVDADTIIVQLQEKAAIWREEKHNLENTLNSRDDSLNQYQINLRLVNAVYGMIATIIALFLLLRLFPSVLTRLIVRNRLLMEVLSMGFLLLTIIILGSAKLIEGQGLAGLLGTIAGYIFARKTQEPTEPTSAQLEESEAREEFQLKVIDAENKLKKLKQKLKEAQQAEDSQTDPKKIEAIQSIQEAIRNEEAKIIVLQEFLSNNADSLPHQNQGKASTSKEETQ
ncbi:MAG: hypothetical protein HUJ26_00750 [Planctomycetaceae bacterium]|nr:hypothetical protein [Planctomycetaceae bacterium]